MPNRKLEIGRGLKALISDIDNINIEEKKKTVQQLANSIAEVLIDSISTNPYQPRREFEKEALTDLSNSIKLHGIIQPLTVRSLGGDRYQLISGERRLRASKIAGLKSVPAYIRIADDQGLLEMALIENIQREDLNVIEVASAYQRLIEECELTHNELSLRIGKNRTSVTNYLRILKLPPTIKNGLRDEKISMGHARALAGLEKVEEQLEAYQIINTDHLSVRDTEKLIKQFSNPNTTKTVTKNNIPSDWKKVQDDLSEHLGALVTIKLNTNGNGNINIKFNDTAHFNEILDLFNSKD